MPELYPDDAALLAATVDPDSGAEHIPTGQSPYHLHFRRLVRRLSAAAAAANALRVFADGALTIGVRPGHCSIASTPIDFTGAAAVAVPAAATTSAWLDAAGELHLGATLPADAASHLPLARITTDAQRITTIDDLRGRTLLRVSDASSIGLTADAATIDRALAGAAASVTAAALGRLTAGPLSLADLDHRHSQFDLTAAAPSHLRLVNSSTQPGATVGVLFSLVGLLPDDTLLHANPATGFLEQSYAGQSYALLGAAHVAFHHSGDLTSSVTGQLAGVVPVAGTVAAVILSLGTNLQSSVSTDGVTATAKVNGVALTTTPPTLTAAAGAGFRSTARGDGAAGVVRSDGAELVQRGDLITVDLTRAATGSVTTEARHAAVLVVIRAAGPE